MNLVNYVTIYVNYVMGVNVSNWGNWQCIQYLSTLIFYLQYVVCLFSFFHSPSSCIPLLKC